MKCAVCGKEFGNGANCQNCGTDRVTGLGNYRGFDPPSNSSENIESSSSRRENLHQTVDNEPKIVKVSSMICHACGEIIPADSKFCPHCSTNLYVTCPRCGHEYPSQYPACNKCGTNRENYYEQKRKEEERQREYERKRREWEKSPEGQAELAKREAERKKREEDRKRNEEKMKIEQEEGQKFLKTLLIFSCVPFIFLAILCLFLLLS